MNTGTTISALCEMVEKRMCSEPDCPYVGRIECAEPGCEKKICVGHAEECEHSKGSFCPTHSPWHGMSCEKAPRGYELDPVYEQGKLQ